MGSKLTERNKRKRLRKRIEELLPHVEAFLRDKNLVLYIQYDEKGITPLPGDEGTSAGYYVRKVTNFSRVLEHALKPYHVKWGGVTNGRPCSSRYELPRDKYDRWANTLVCGNPEHAPTFVATHCKNLHFSLKSSKQRSFGFLQVLAHGVNENIYSKLDNLPGFSDEVKKYFQWYAVLVVE